jgi:putative FmdB family regulatory protein
VPLYDYDCAACGRRFEVIHGVNDPGPESCPLCGSGPVRKAFAPPAIHFKGSGWAKKERRAAVKSSASSGDADRGSDGEGTSTTSDTPDKSDTSGKPDTSKKAPTGSSGSSGSDSSSSTSASSTSSD